MNKRQQIRSGVRSECQLKVITDITPPQQQSILDMRGRRTVFMYKSQCKEPAFCHTHWAMSLFIPAHLTPWHCVVLWMMPHKTLMYKHLVMCDHVIHVDWCPTSYHSTVWALSHFVISFTPILRCNKWTFQGSHVYTLSIVISALVSQEQLRNTS